MNTDRLLGLIKSRKFNDFLKRGFWPAHSATLVWRLDGQDVNEEADWLKDVWYALRKDTVFPTEEELKLAQFYGVETRSALIDAQALHIRRLQDKLPPLKDTEPHNYRRG